MIDNIHLKLVFNGRAPRSTWIGVSFENEQSPSRDEKDTALHKESSVNLRDLFFFPFVSAIVAAVVRWIPVNYWYGCFFDQNRA